MGIERERSYKWHHENEPGDIEIRVPPSIASLHGVDGGLRTGEGERAVTHIRVADNADRMKYPGFPAEGERERPGLD